ncbi:MAG: LPS export ABC transporter periplasmic protein LptC [Treponema sp.]|jgi:LPS export ABC transporter protein LptC|nr:LPS export ABC transporter periplasmic protein LptC [Treponema sp.]
MGRTVLKFLIPLFAWFSWACSFDYGSSESGSEDQPDIIMREVEYVRVRDGDPQVRFQAETAERFEKRQIMELRNFSFEQFEKHGDEINAVGRAGTASVELDSGDIQLGDGVRINVDSEDITIETSGLKWQDSERLLSGEADAQVDIKRSDGTSFTGTGFSTYTRERTWAFVSGASGTYVHEDDDEEEGEGEEAGTGDEGAGPAAVSGAPSEPDDSGEEAGEALVEEVLSEGESPR